MAPEGPVYSAPILTEFEGSGAIGGEDNVTSGSGDVCRYRHSGTFGRNRFTCVRETWRDYSRCIWHARLDHDEGASHLPLGADEGVEPILRKPFDELKAARRDGFERLDGARLQGTLLGDIDFTDCSLAGARFDGAQLRWAEDTDLLVPHATKLDDPHGQLRSPTFTNATLVGAVFEEADFPTADFRDADMQEANMVDSGFALGIFDETDLYVASCESAFFGYAQFSNANMESADFTDANFSNAQVRDGSAKNANFTRADLTNVTFQDTDLHGADFADVKVDHETDFGDSHYPADLDKAIWVYRQLEALARRNARSDRVKKTFTQRKDLQRRLYWHRSKVPQSVSRIATRVNPGENGCSPDDESRSNREKWANTAKWLWLAFTGGLMRYGESLQRVIAVSVLTIIGFAIAYPFAGGIWDAGNVYTFDGAGEILSIGGVEVFLRSLYFSTITFTTIGYANVRPNGMGSRFLVGIESFAGALLLATLVFVIGRRSTR